MMGGRVPGTVFLRLHQWLSLVRKRQCFELLPDRRQRNLAEMLGTRGTGVHVSRRTEMPRRR